MYPTTGPVEWGLLDVGDGNRLYWETSGNPDGKPVVVLHDGPGGAAIDADRQYFDPARYRVILFDQRGCGRSEPSLGDPAQPLGAHTLWHLLADLEALRVHLGVEAWQLFGVGWGTALALVYAQTHPERVTELVLNGVCTLRREEIDWCYQGGAAALFPDLWADFLAPVPFAQRGKLVEAYAALLADPDADVVTAAGLSWSRWDAMTATLLPREDILARYADPKAAVARARFATHVFLHAGWLREGQLLEDTVRIRHLPTVVVQGRYDVRTPLVATWELCRVWPEVEVHLVEDAGHASDEPGVREALAATTDRFAEVAVCSASTADGAPVSADARGATAPPSAETGSTGDALPAPAPAPAVGDPPPAHATLPVDDRTGADTDAESVPLDDVDDEVTFTDSAPLAAPVGVREIDPRLTGHERPSLPGARE